MKVCDKCRKPMEKGIDCLGAELCESCATRIKEWIKKPEKQGFNFGNVFGGQQ